MDYFALIYRWFLCQGSGSGLEGLLPSTPGFVLVLDPLLQDQQSKFSEDSYIGQSLRKISSQFLSRHILLKCNIMLILKTLMMIIYVLSLPNSFVTNSGCGFEAFITMDFDLVVSVFNRKEHCSVEISDTNLGDEHWVHHSYIL